MSSLSSGSLNLISWLALVLSIVSSLIYIRDLGDFSQMLIRVRRENMARAIRHERLLLLLAWGGSAVSVTVQFVLHANTAPLVLSFAAILFLVTVGTWLWLHVGLRPDQDSARIVPIETAKNFIRPEESVLVIEQNGGGRAHADRHLARPHVVSTDTETSKQQVVMTYCALARCGIAFESRINGERHRFCAIAQFSNNLILRDQETREPIQQIYGRSDDGQTELAAWPTFRMTFRGFSERFPNGEVYLRKTQSVWRNPFLAVFDRIIDAAFALLLTEHHHHDALLLDTMDVEDARLRRKALVWGIDIEGDACAFTEDFVREKGGLVHTRVGTRDIVLAYDEKLESLGAYYSNGNKVTHVDFDGNSDAGKLARVERLKPGMYWFVWVNYYPSTDINRTSGSAHSEPTDRQRPSS